MLSFRLFAFTVVELLTLVLWLSFLKNLPVIAFGVLIVGLVIEHVIAFSKSPAKIVEIVGISTSEAVIWAIWIMIASTHIYMSLAILALLMLLQHQVERNIFLRKSTFSLKDISKVVDFTLIESAGATLWLLLVLSKAQVAGIVVLSVALLVEHFIQTAKLKDNG